MKGQIDCVTYRGWIQIIVLDRFALPYNSKFLESVYQHLHLCFGDQRRGTFDFFFAKVKLVFKKKY
jgi:hypothetical protein